MIILGGWRFLMSEVPLWGVGIRVKGVRCRGPGFVFGVSMLSNWVQSLGIRVSRPDSSGFSHNWAQGLGNRVWFFFLRVQGFELSFEGWA